MFGSGMLTDVDFNSLSWHTLFLVGGGNVLGKAVQAARSDKVMGSLLATSASSSCMALCTGVTTYRRSKLIVHLKLFLMGDCHPQPTVIQGAGCLKLAIQTTIFQLIPDRIQRQA
jgi:hypothetical protein